jgi:hypothetical protein
MSNSVQSTPAAASAFAAFCLPIMLLAFTVPGASAQCSQATRPKTASTAQPAASAQSQQPVPAKEDSSSSDAPMDVRFATGAAITVLENTPLQVITDSPISSRTAKEGAKLPFTVTRDVVVNGILVIPCGARVYGTVVSAKQAGRATGASSLTLQLTELNLDGKTYPLYTPLFKVVGESKTRPTVNKAAKGAVLGAVAMDARAESMNFYVPAGPRLVGDVVGAGLGAGIGTAIGARTPPSIALIPSESQIEFTLATPVAIFPVDQRTAARLAQGMHRGGPVLYIRGENQ